MADMRAPAIFLAQFVGAEAPFDNLANMARWAYDPGYKGVQLPTWVSSLIDLEDGAREGVDFIRRHMIRTTDKAFDDFADSGADEAANRRILGID